LIWDIGVGPSIPSSSGIRDALRNLEILNIGWALEYVDVQTGRHVPRNVAMHWPNTWVIIGPLYNDEAWCVVIWSRSEDLNIANLRVCCVDNSAIPISSSLSENVEVVTVQMHGMRSVGEVVLEDKLNSGICAKVEHVPLWLEGHVTAVDMLKGWVIVVTTEGGVVHGPDEVCAVAAENHIDGLGDSWSANLLDAESGRQAEVIVTTVSELGIREFRCCCWNAVGISILVVEACESLWRNGAGE